MRHCLCYSSRKVSRIPWSWMEPWNSSKESFVRSAERLTPVSNSSSLIPHDKMLPSPWYMNWSAALDDKWFDQVHPNVYGIIAWNVKRISVPTLHMTSLASMGRCLRLLLVAKQLTFPLLHSSNGTNGWCFMTLLFLFQMTKWFFDVTWVLQSTLSCYDM